MTTKEYIDALYEAFLSVEPVEFYGQKLRIFAYQRVSPYFDRVEHTFKFEGGNELKIMLHKEDLE